MTLPPTRRADRFRPGFAALAAASLLFMACALVELPLPAYTGSKWDPGPEAPRYRGANLTCAGETELAAADFARWKSWGINLIRINFNKDDIGNAASDPPSDGDPWRPYARNRAKLAQWLGWCNDNRIEAMVALDHLWGDDHALGAMWWFGGANDYLRHRVRLAAAMADWLGTDWPLARWLEPWNEPHPYDDLYRTKFLPDCLAAVRAVNPDITVVCMAPGDWGLPGSLDGWDGVTGQKVAYSTHLYAPQTYTHQGVNGLPRLPGRGWPGSFRTYPDSPETWCDRAALAAYVGGLAALGGRTGKRVFVTEFGVLRWAAGNENYLADAVSVFEEQGDDWVLHSLAGWNGWNPTFDAGAPESTDSTGSLDSPAFAVMRAAWARNLP